MCYRSAREQVRNQKCEIKYEEIIAGNAPHLKEEID